MGRRRRVDSDGLLPCQCQDCSKQNPEGMQITQQVFDEHRRRERLRKTLLNKSDGLRTDLETEPTKTDMVAGRYMDSHIRDKSGALERIASGSSPANTNNTQVISSSSSSAAEPATVEDDDYLRHIIYETRMRLETLYDDEIRLKFISPPSPEQQAFVFPDHQSLLRVNSGEFALKTTSACNRRLLDAEARFCGLLKTIQSKPPEERLLGDVDVEGELFEALNKVHRIKERQWRLQHISGDTIVENSFRFNQIRLSDVSPTLLAALIIYIKFQTPARKMRVILAMFRCVIESSMKKQRIQSVTPSSIPKDIHIIVDFYNLNPTLHTYIACPKCYGLSPLTDATRTCAETAFDTNVHLPVCNERLDPDSSPCGTPLWQSRRIGVRSIVTPIRTQVFQDLKVWIGRLLAIPSFEEIISEHQQRSAPADGGPEKDFVDSAAFREFKGPDGQPFAIPQKGPGGSLDLRLVMSLGFDGFNPFSQRETHAIVQSTALYMVVLSLPEHLRYRQEYMFLVTIIPGKPGRHVNHTVRKLVEQLLLFWKGVFYTCTARYPLGRTVFAVLIPVVCDTEAAIMMAGFAAHNHTYFCRRCLLPINDIHNLNPESWGMRDSIKHRELAFESKDASPARRDAIYKAHGVRWTELLELPYWDPILFTVIDDMHLGYLGLFETHLRKIWGINHEKKGGDGLEPMPEAKKLSKASLRQLLNGIRGNLPILRNVLMAENKASLWYICFMLNLRTGLRNKQQLVDQILQWRSRSTPEAVPEVPFLSFDQVPDGWEASETAKNSGELSDSEASETSLSSSVTNSDILPLVSRRAPLFNFNKDADFEDLKSKLLNLSFKAPSLTRPAKEVLQALCQDLNIAYNAQDTKKHLITRLMIYRQENGADDDSNGSEVRYNKLKRQFEESEPSKTTLMSCQHAHLERLCRECSIPIPTRLTKINMARRLILWRQEHRHSTLKQKSIRDVIGKDILEQIWADMERTVLPSWIQQAPPKWGIPASGKLSADEYKVICSIHMVITLIRVWGYENEEGPQSRSFQMLLNFLDLVHSIHVLFLRETSTKLRVYYKTRMLKYLRTVLELFPDVTLASNHHLAVHIVNDLEYLGPGHARSTPVFERINHRLQEIKKNGHQGEVEATMLKTYCRQANLELILDHNIEIREEIKEALGTLKDIEREDHRGIFAGTDLLAWSSTQFKATSIYLEESTLDRIVHHLNTLYTVPDSHWDGKVTRQAQLVGGVAHGRVIYSPKVRQNSVIFHDGGNIHAATIESVINHSHPHPTTRESVTITYIEISILEPIKTEDDLYRDLDCGWLCLQTPTTKKITTIPLTSVISHFARTDLAFHVNGKRVTHVFPVPKVFHGNDSGRPTPT